MVWTSIDSTIVKEIPYWLEVTSIVLTMILGFLSLALGVWSVFLAMDLKEKKSMRKIILEINLYFNNLKEFKKIELEKITDDNILMFMTYQRKWDSIPFKYKEKILDEKYYYKIFENVKDNKTRTYVIMDQIYTEKHNYNKIKMWMDLKHEE